MSSLSTKKVIAGINDLATTDSDIAAEAYEWNPSTLSRKSNEYVKWKCELGHIYGCIIANRTGQGQGCPYCSGHQVLAGFNDIATTHKSIAQQANGWDATQYSYGSNEEMSWNCPKCNKSYMQGIASRTIQGTGCPSCAEYGFNPEKDAWFYLMERKDEQMLGITNDPKTRIRNHKRNVWNLLDMTDAPAKGSQVLNVEKKFKCWLRDHIGLVPGTLENWYTSALTVNSLSELKEAASIECSIF